MSASSVIERSARVGQTLNFRVAAPSWVSMGRGFDFLCVSTHGIDADQSVFGIRVERKTAPGPVFRVIDQFSFQRVHMHVVELFDSLLQTPHIEVVKPPLPKPGLRIFSNFKAQMQLPSIRSLSPAQAPGDALFQDLNHKRRCSLGRLADQQVNVIRHNDVANECKTVALPDFAENLNESILGTNRTQEGHAPVTTERDEMKMPAPVNSNQFVGHGVEGTSKPRPFENREGSATRKSETRHSGLTYWGGIIHS